MFFYAVLWFSNPSYALLFLLVPKQDIANSYLSIQMKFPKLTIPDKCTLTVISSGMQLWFALLSKRQNILIIWSASFYDYFAESEIGVK